VSRPAVRVGCWRRRVTGVQEEWPSRMRACSHAIQNPAYRLADLYLRASGAIPPDARQVFGFGLLALWHAPCIQMRLGSRNRSRFGCEADWTNLLQLAK
jgi:hypothetical protein